MRFEDQRLHERVSGSESAGDSGVCAWYPEDYPEPEVVLLLHRSKFKVLEIPVKMRRRMYGKSSISLAQGLFYVLKVGVCLLLDTVRQPWPMGRINAP